MRSFVFFVFNFVILVLISMTGLSLGEEITVENCGSSIYQDSASSRIVGGYYVRHGEYPWMGSLQYDEPSEFIHICGASVLNENWIITAAHCFMLNEDPMAYRVILGLYKLFNMSDENIQKIKISQIIRHEEYENSTYHNDIALLRTMTPIDIAGSNGYVNGICLPEPGSDAKGDATVIGWGITQYGDISTTLRGVSVPIISSAHCNEVYKAVFQTEEDIVTNNKICAGTYQRDSCAYDSGGPLFRRNENGKATLIGLVSIGMQCGVEAFPAIYTKVSSYIDWIQNVTQT